MKTNASFVVIGDVVASRAAADRVLLHQVLSETLAAANERFGSDLRITVGDEYQGHCQTLGQALGRSGGYGSSCVRGSTCGTASGSARCTPSRFQPIPLLPPIPLLDRKSRASRWT